MYVCVHICVYVYICIYIISKNSAPGAGVVPLATTTSRPTAHHAEPTSIKFTAPAKPKSKPKPAAVVVTDGWRQMVRVHKPLSPGMVLLIWSMRPEMRGARGIEILSSSRVAQEFGIAKSSVSTIWNGLTHTFMLQGMDEIPDIKM